MNDKVEVYKLQNGMILGKPIYGENGEVMISSGTSLDDYCINYLKMHKIRSILIYSKEYLNSLVESDDAKRVIEKLRRADLATINLSNSVRERIDKGITFLFTNTDSKDFINIVENISNDLISTISENNAIRIDIDKLKTSDNYTFKHSVDVASLSMIIAKNLDLSLEQINEIGVAGILHDIGKSKIPLDILNKPDKLTNNEFEIIKEHSVIGFNILNKIETLSPDIKNAVLSHHEKMDGSGYPYGLSNDKIPLYAKILSIADIYDALITDRPYKNRSIKKDAIEIIMSMTNELDTDIINAFLKSVILYPVDSIVHLSNGIFAKVIENYLDAPLRPKLVDIMTGIVYDLKNDEEYKDLTIL